MSYGHFGTNPSAEVSYGHFGTSAEVSYGHFGTSAEVSYGHFGKCLRSEVSWVRSVLIPWRLRWTGRQLHGHEASSTEYHKDGADVSYPRTGVFNPLKFVYYRPRRGRIATPLSVHFTLYTLKSLHLFLKLQLSLDGCQCAPWERTTLIKMYMDNKNVYI